MVLTSEYCEKLGLDKSIFENPELSLELADTELFRKYIPKRYKNSNKGSFGKALLYVGSNNMTGAAYLSALGSLRCGAGLTILVSEKAVTDILKTCLYETVFLPTEDGENGTEALLEYSKSCSAFLVGCGLSRGKEKSERVFKIIKNAKIPLIIDADGINAVSENINILSEAKCDILLTPHPLEFSRLTGFSVEQIEKNRVKYALEFSEKYNCTLLLKGVPTVICERGKRVCINPTGNSALAKGGTGDVLSGMITAFTAQGASLYESAVISAYLHGAAGERLSQECSEYGVIASQIPECCARLICEILK